MGSLSIWHWLIVLLIVVLIFGTKKLKNMGEDLGGAVKGFKKGLDETEKKDPLERPSALNHPPKPEDSFARKENNDIR